MITIARRGFNRVPRRLVGSVFQSATSCSLIPSRQRFRLSCCQCYSQRSFGDGNSRSVDREDDGSEDYSTPRNAFEAIAEIEKSMGLSISYPDQSSSDSEGNLDMNRVDNDDDDGEFGWLFEDDDTEDQKRLNVGIIGEPNVGKSSLLNLLVSSHVSAVSPKRNTTRDAIVGVHMSDNTQLVFYDTPGFMQEFKQAKTNREFYQSIQNSVNTLCRKVDVILLVIDAARRLDLNKVNVIEDLGKVCSVLEEAPDVVLVLNKVDRVEPKENLLVTSQILHEEAQRHFPKGMLPTCYTDCSQAATARDVIKRSPPPSEEPLTDSDDETEVIKASISAASQFDGVQDVVDQLLLLAKPGEWQFDPLEVTDLDPEGRALEAVKEAVFQLCHKELPYLVTPHTIDFMHPDESETGRYLIRHRLEVPTKSHARILGGGLLQAIRRRAESALAGVLEHPVNLDLSVRVAPKRR